MHPRHGWSLIAEDMCPRRNCHGQCGVEVEKEGKDSAHSQDSLPGDTIDPRRKNRLHCVLEAVIEGALSDHVNTTFSG